MARTDSRQSSLARIGTRESSLAVPDIEPVPIRNELVQKQHLQPAPQPMIGPIAPPRRSSRSRSRSIEEKHKTTAMVPIGPPLAPLHHPMSPIGEEEAKKVLHASCERIDTLQQCMRSSTEALAPLGQFEATASQPTSSVMSSNTSVRPQTSDTEGGQQPLCTSSPKLSHANSQFSKQPQRLALAPTLEEEEGPEGARVVKDERMNKDEVVDAACENKQTQQRQTLLNTYLPPTRESFQPTLSPIISSRTENNRPLSPNLSITSNNSEATLVGQFSLETDSSRTVMFTANETFDNSESKTLQLTLNDTFDNSEMSDFESFSCD